MFFSPILSNLSIFCNILLKLTERVIFLRWSLTILPKGKFFLHKCCYWRLLKIPRLSFARQVLRLAQKEGRENWLVLIVSWLSFNADDDVGDDFVFGPLDPRLIIIWSSLRVTLIFILTPGITSWHLSYRSWSNIFCLDDHSPSYEMEAQYV